MSAAEWLRAVASVSALAVGVVAASQAARNPLSRPLAALSLDLAASHGAVLAGLALPSDLAGALVGPLSLDLAAAFTGRLRALRLVRAAAFALALGAFVLGTLYGRGVVSALAITAASAFPFAVALFALARHFGEAPGVDEQLRTRLLAGATLVGATLGVTEPASWVLPGVPPLGSVATLACVGVAGVVALRIERLERAPAARWVAYALGLAALGLVAGVGAYRVAGGRLVAGAAGTCLVVVASLVALRSVVASYAAEREQIRQLATVGRFASQMAHDLKNPLAVVTGAAQFLKEEHARGNSLAEYGDFLELMVNELERMRRVADNYQRLGRVEVRLSLLDVNELVRGVLALQGFATGGRVEVRVELADGVPRCSLDRDLIENALKNLVRNASEAMPGPGTLTVRTSLAAPAEGEAVVITVEDTGVGMDARTRERALDSFYTTKPEGSGLGLAFVRRVVDAHGGELTLTSVEGRGTTVRVRLPSRPATVGA